MVYLDAATSDGDLARTPVGLHSCVLKSSLGHSGSVEAPHQDQVGAMDPLFDLRGVGQRPRR